MNYIPTEVAELRIDHKYSDAKPRQRGGATAAAAREMRQLLRAMAETRQDRPAEALPAEALLVPQAPAQCGLAPWQMRKVRAHIEAGLSGVIRVHCLAGIARLSASHFTRAFKASFGATPGSYVNARRVERAKAMMLETDIPLCQISLDCGFTDQSHLSRVFHRVAGRPPSQWRRQHRQA